MKTVFAGKNYVVVGGASGIGLATARRLIASGAGVMLWDSHPERLKVAGDELNTPTILVDITEPEQVLAATLRTIETFPKIDGVIHCAAVLRTGLFEHVELSDHLRMVNVNFAGTLNVVHALLPCLRQSAGTLVLLASVSAFYGPPEFSTYAATKAAVVSFAQSLRVELHGSGVLVSVVTPNFVDTPMLDARNRAAKMVRSPSPFLKLETADAIAGHILVGISARRFIISTGWRSSIVYAMSRYLAFAAETIMKRTWLNAQRRVK